MFHVNKEVELWVNLAKQSVLTEDFQLELKPTWQHEWTYYKRNKVSIIKYTRNNVLIIYLF